MTKTFKNLEIVNIINKLNDSDSLINSKNPDKKLSVAVLWKINGNLKALNTIYDRISEEEQKINAEYFNSKKSDTNADGQLEIKPQFREQFFKDKNDLMNIENEVEISMISLDELSAFNFIPADFLSIEFMITE